MSTTPRHPASVHAVGEGFVTAWGRIHLDLCRLTGSICRA